MPIQSDFRALGCKECATGSALGFDFSMAFQPIINCSSNRVYAYEALVRGTDGRPAAEVFKKVDANNQYRFDQACRVKAIKLAAELGIQCKLSINFLPNAIYQPELCIRTTLAAAQEYKFPTQNIIFEFTENEQISDPDHLKKIVDYYRFCGFTTAIDDFGSGYAGLNLLADLRTDLIKLDMALIRNIHMSKPRQAIIKGIIRIAEELNVQLLAEGIEQPEEFFLLQSWGIDLFQGYLFARPAFESLPPINFTPLRTVL